MYLGSRMSEADQNAIREIARKKYAHAAIYLARKSGLLCFGGANNKWSGEQESDSCSAGRQGLF
jgi:hypothetical protein